MEVISTITGIFADLGLDAIADVVNSVTNIITGLLPAEESFLVKLTSFFSGADNVLVNIANFDLDYLALDNIIDSISNLFNGIA